MNHKVIILIYQVCLKNFLNFHQYHISVLQYHVYNNKLSKSKDLLNIYTHMMISENIT